MNNILSPSETSLLESLQKTTKKLQFALMQADETIVLLKLYVLYHKTQAPEIKSKNRK